MHQVPAMTHMFSSSVTSTATAQASMSNIPPGDGVPATSPVSRGGLGRDRPQISVEY